MTDKTSKINGSDALPSRWQGSLDALKAIQVAFDLTADIQRNIRKKAVDQDISPSDMLRKILDLPVKSRRVRPRLTMSLTPEDQKMMAERYNLDPSDTHAIRQQAAAELKAWAEKKK